MRGNRLSIAATGALAMALTTGAQAEPSQYLCVVESAAGLHYDAQTQSWKPQAFGTGRKYVLRRLNDDDSVLIRWNDEYLKKFVNPNKPKPNWAFFEYGKDLAKD